MTDRTDALLQVIQDRISDLREDVATLTARVEGLTSAAPVVEALRRDHGALSNSLAEARADLRRLWWLAGVWLSALSAAVARVFTGGSTQ